MFKKIFFLILFFPIAAFSAPTYPIGRVPVGNKELLFSVNGVPLTIPVQNSGIINKKAEVFDINIPTSSGSSVTAVENINGTSTITSTPGGTADAIRPINELLNAGLLTGIETFPILQSGNHVRTSVSSLPDFWRSGVGGTTLPNVSADLTENIRRNGNVGLNVDPISTLDINGSFGANFRIVTVTGSINTNDYTIAVQNSTTNITLTLPLPAISIRRIYCIKRFTPSTGTITILPGAGTIEALAGTFGATTTLAALGTNGSRVCFQSSGVDWHRITT